MIIHVLLRISRKVLTYQLIEKMNDQSLIQNLPLEITTDIFLRLPTKTIVTCKCVCKNWQKHISTHQFSESHLLKSTPGLVVNLTQSHKTLCSTFEFEDAIGIQPHDFHYKPLIKFDPNTLHSNSLKPIIWIECSVNGLLCLRDYSTERDTLLICNPIVRECITLPGHGGAFRYPKLVTYGVGISALSFKYKVVKISKNPVDCPRRQMIPQVKLDCMVYTLGTCSWRSIELNEKYENGLGSRNGVFLNGNLHWWTEDENRSQVIACFDLETELFKPFASPPSFPYIGIVVTVLEECLCICDYGSDDEIVIWIMKDYGVEDSWMKKFVISKYEELGGILYESVTPLKVFGNGDILMLWENTCMFYHCKEKGTTTKVDLFERDRYGGIYALLHTPTFISLRSFELENVTSF